MSTPEIFLEQINAEAIREEWESGGSRRLKRELIKGGYPYQVSFYGILTDSEDGESQYSRIEVLSDAKLEGSDVLLLHDWFHELKPLDKYTIWVYRKSTREVALKGRFL